MSNNFPTPPTGYNISSVQYTARNLYVSGFPGVSSGSSLDFGNDVGFNFQSSDGMGMSWLLTLSFPTPGTIGSFDQTTADTKFTDMINDYCQSVVDVFGDTLANVQAQTTATRSFVFVDSSGDTITYTSNLA